MNINQTQAFGNQTIKIDELKEKLKKWEDLADNLIVHAQNLRGSSLMWGHEEWYEDISEDIIQYKKLKNES